MGLLDDKQLREAVDDLLSSAAIPADSLMNRLRDLGWKPVGEAHITLLGLMLIIPSAGYEGFQSLSDKQVYE